jgi:DNA adenine methylase
LSSEPSIETHSRICAANEAREPLNPFLRWPGGKRWIAKLIADVVQARLRNVYFEPFLGGAAVFFFLRPGKAVLSDLNLELINTYKIVRAQPREVVEALRRLQVSSASYYHVRSHLPSNSLRRAARFLYLNRTAFSGMYRVNKKGDFNVPYGGGDRTPELLLHTTLIKDASAALRKAKLKNCDFEDAIDSARGGDVVYCDPTYTVTHDQNGFIRYNECNFSWADQERLAKAARRARRRGAAVIVSNAHHKEIKKIYSNAKFQVLTRQSTLSADPDKRRAVHEYLIIL